MKRQTLLTALAIITSPLFAVEPVPSADTVAHIANPRNVLVTENGTTTKIEVNGSATRPNYHFEYSVTADSISESPAISLPFIGSKMSRPSRREVSFFSDVYYGAVLPYHGPAEVRTSQEVGVGNLLGYRFRFGTSTDLGFGFGFGTKQLTVRRGMQANCTADRFSFQPTPEGSTNVRTNLALWNLQVPFYYRQRIYRSLAFKVAVILNYNVSARATTTYTLDKVDYKKKVDGLHQRLITPDFSFTFGSLDFGGVYVRWSPVKMFKRAYGPDIETLSIGLSLSF